VKSAPPSGCSARAASSRPSRENLDADALAAQPLAGALFCVDLPGVRGLPVLEFAG